MGFDSLLGNERLKENLRQSLRRGHGSHFYLISGPVGSGKKTLARLLAAALLCQSEEKPCGCCTPCKKVMGGVHPDFITIDDPEKKTVTIDLIRQARGDIYIQPNEGNRKIYLFPRAQDMQLPGQNALLKILEEPPPYGVFLLLTDNPNKLLPTVRSRCVELAMQALPSPLLRRELQSRFPQVSTDTIASAITRSGGYLGQAISLLEGSSDYPEETKAFVEAFATRNTVALLQVLVPMEKWKRDALIPILQQWLELLEEGLVGRTTHQAVSELAGRLSDSRNRHDLMEAIGQLQKCITYAQGNVSPAAVCGYLQWALR